MEGTSRRTGPTAGATWEYHTAAIRPDDEAHLNRLGAEGWELVAVVPAENPASPVCYFKRPALSFKERVTLEQKHRYYRQWGHEIPEDERGDRRMN
jgi:hypothetical protein